MVDSMEEEYTWVGRRDFQQPVEIDTSLKAPNPRLPLQRMRTVFNNIPNNSS